jgi:hypothetical protein
LALLTTLLGISPEWHFTKGETVMNEKIIGKEVEIFEIEELEAKTAPSSSAGFLE